MDNECFELCKEVYELTGWEDVRDFYHENDTFDEETQTFKRNGIFSIVERKRADYNIPLYTSDYLLEKLPPTIVARGNAFSTATRIAETSKQLIGTEADTPLKALLKLTIALDDAGIKL